MTLRRDLIVTALASSVVTVLACWSLGGEELKTVVKVDNPRVLVTEVTSPAAGVRPRGKRAMDQVVVFLDDCRYERVDAVTGEKSMRERKAGDVLWQGKGEDVPQLTNVGSKPYRSIVIELK